jgi:hypothetical protein
MFDGVQVNSSHIVAWGGGKERDGQTDIAIVTVSVVRVPDYSSRGPGSVPGTSRFSDKW